VGASLFPVSFIDPCPASRNQRLSSLAASEHRVLLNSASECFRVSRFPHLGKEVLQNAWAIWSFFRTVACRLWRSRLHPLCGSIERVLPAGHPPSSRGGVLEVFRSAHVPRWRRHPRCPRSLAASAPLVEGECSIGFFVLVPASPLAHDKGWKQFKQQLTELWQVHILRSD
jgi:hypothetical protein